MATRAARRALALLLFGASGSVATTASGQPRLEWASPAACPGRAAAVAEIESLLGESLAESWPPSLRIESLIARGALGFRLAITIDDGAHRVLRSLEDEASCGTLVHAAALIIAIAIDPSIAPPAVVTQGASAIPGGEDRPAPPSPGTAPPASPVTPEPPATGSAPDSSASPSDTSSTTAGPPPSPSAETTAAPPASPPEPATSPRRHAASRSRRRPSWLAVRLGAAGDVGMLPAPTVGLSAAGAWTHRGLRVELLFGAWLVQQGTPPSTSEANADISVVAGSLRGCARVVAARPAPWACAGAELGWMQGAGHGVGSPSSGGAAWLAAVGGLALAMPLGRSWALWGEVGPLLAVVRPRFFFEDLGDVHQPARVGGRMLAAVEWRWR